MNHLEMAKQIAKEAGELIKSRMGTSYKASEKSSSFDIVTEMDQASEQLIRERIRECWPEHCFLGEEEAYGDADNLSGRLERAAKEPFVWIVDPIDGTSNYFHNLPGYTVSIALACEGELKVGVIYDPCSDELYWAERGQGAFLNGKRIQVSGEERVDRILIGTGFPTEERARAAVVETLVGLSSKCRSIRSFGSAALQLAFVACGKLGAYWEHGLNIWDTAAGALLIEEAEGTVTDAAGRPFNLSTKHVVASNGYVHRTIVDYMKRID